MMSSKSGILFFVLMTSGFVANSSPILPKLTPNLKDNETTKVSKEAAAEALITQAEEKALDTLEAILKKNKGKPNEPDLWLRRGELYMRRARSARFFEFQRADVEKAATFVPATVKDQKSRKHLVEANRSYLKVFNEFASHSRADQALFTFSFNLEQLGESDKAAIYYSQLVNQYPESPLVPDSYLALGEIHFGKTQFERALTFFDNVTNFKTSRAYWYAEYKKGWAYYNLKNNTKAIDQILLVIQKAPTDANRISLREEALKDSTLFFTESRPSEDAYKFYSNLITDELDLVKTLLRLTDLYNRHSRFEDSNVVYTTMLKKHSNPELQAKILTKQSHMFLTDKAYVLSSKTLGLAVEACEKIKNLSSECEIDLPEIQTKLIKTMWANKKKNPQDAIGSAELEKQIKAALSSATTAEAQQKFSNLLGDYYYESSRHHEAGKQYYSAHKIRPNETALLAAIDAMTLAAKTDSIARPILVTYIDSFTSAYPTSTRATDLRIKKIAIHLQEKQPLLALPEFSVLHNQKALSASDQLLVEDLYFDYLNQIQDFGTLLVESKKAVTRTSDLNRKASLAKVIDEIALKVAENSIGTSNTLAQKKDVIATLGEIAIYSKTLDPKNKRSAHLLAIKEAFNNKLYLLALRFSKRYIELYPEDPETLDIKKSSLKLSLDLGDLRSALKLSQDLLGVSKERDRSGLVKSILELQQAIGSQNELRAFAEKNLSNLTEVDRAALFQYFWESAHEVQDNEFANWTEQKIKQYKIEPLSSQIHLFQIESLLGQRRYEDAFSKSKKYMSSQFPKDIRARARLIQGKIFEKELLDIGSKTRMDRLQMVIGIKTERLEKAQKAYTDVIELADHSSAVYLEGYLGLERTLGEYVRYLSELEIKNSNTAETQQVKEALTQIGAPLKNKLSQIQTKILSLRQAQKISQSSQNFATAKFEFLSEQASFEPVIDERIADLFPALVLGKPSSCKTSELPNTPEFKFCLANAKNLEKVAEFLDASQGYEFSKGELPYLRSFEAGRNGRNKEASYLLSLAIAQNSSNESFRYQLGRHLIATGQIKSGLNQLYQAYLNGMELENLKLVTVIDGYLQNNCYKALAFADSVKAIKGASHLLSPILSECFAKTGSVKDAIKILDEVFKPQSEHFLQYARVYEDYSDNSALAESFYSKALQASNNNSMKVWLIKKISYIKSQAQYKKADKNESEGLRQ